MWNHLEVSTPGSEFPQGPLEFYSGFLVGLNVFARVPDGRIQHYLYSGFVVEHDDRWLWITAGHAFSELDRALEAGVEILSAGFYDRLIGDRFNEQPYIPLPDLARMRRVFVDDDEADFGLLEIPDLIRKNLEANGVPPVTRDKVDDGRGRFSTYALIGFPEEAVSYVAEGENSRVLMAPVVLWLNRLEDRPTGEVSFMFQFQAMPGSVMIEDQPLQSIKGMSGGLIIAFREGQPRRFVAFAIQSSWNSSTWRLFATPLWPVMCAIVDAAKADSGS